MRGLKLAERHDRPPEDRVAPSRVRGLKLAELALHFLARGCRTFTGAWIVKLCLERRELDEGRRTYAVAER